MVEESVEEVYYSSDDELPERFTVHRLQSLLGGGEAGERGLSLSGVRQLSLQQVQEGAQ